MKTQKVAQPEDLIHRQQITALLNSGKIQELEVKETAAVKENPARAEVHMLIIKGPTPAGVERSPAAQEAAQEARPVEVGPETALPRAASVRRITKEASKELEKTFPPEWLKSMGL